MTNVQPIRKKSDITKIEKVLKLNNYRDFVLFKLGINCGLRISDLLKLNVEDVKYKTYICLTEQKTGKYKRIPINDKLKQIILAFTKERDENEPLFKTKSNKRLDRTMAYRIIKNACNKINIDVKIGTHTLRKTFGYHFYKKFKNILLLQKIFNHSTSQITLRYIGIEQEIIEKAYLSFIL